MEEQGINKTFFGTIIKFPSPVGSGTGEEEGDDDNSSSSNNVVGGQKTHTTAPPLSMMSHDYELGSVLHASTELLPFFG